MAYFNVSLSNVKFYNVTKLDVVKGQHLRIELFEVTEPNEWTSTNDPVLDIHQEGNVAEVDATALGTSKIYIVNNNFGKIIELSIRVVEEINADAVALGVKVEPPVLK